MLMFVVMVLILVVLMMVMMMILVRLKRTELACYNCNECTIGRRCESYSVQSTTIIYVPTTDDPSWDLICCDQACSVEAI
ncbi:hypothetical protein F4825DRAFT_427315 [Nemania diffusa]|nr:hypothetical protein F4825DRAFT_427315 [Nemania diffusa]